MKRLALILLLVAGAFLPLPGQERSEGQTLLFRPQQNLTRAQIGLRLREEDDAYIPAEGKGLVQAEFRAYSTHSLDSVHRVEGKASYERGVKRGVNWNTSSDWDLLAPYITLDSLGGDLQKEQYSFSARFASRPGRFFYSLWADYRALHEYREVDPRPRNITADLQVAAQGGVQTGRYALSLEAGYRKYHQSNNTEFMDPRGNNTSILHYLGFGRYSARFSGAKQSTAVNFNGNGFSSRLVLEPVDGLGWIAGGSYSWLQLVRHLPGNNETPVSELLVQNISLYGGHKWEQAHIRADASLRLKTGTENIIDQTSAFLSLAGLQMYQAYSWNAGVSGSRSWKAGRLNWAVLPRLSYSGTLLQNMYPGAGMSFHHAQASAAGRAAFQLGSWHFLAQGDISARLCLASGLDIDRLPLDNRFEAYLSHLHDRWKGHALRAGFSARAGRAITKGMALYIRPEAAYTRAFPERHHRWDACLAIGIEF